MKTLTDFQELERIYQRLCHQPALAVAVTACQPQEGVSTLVDAMAERACRAGKQVLVVDLNLHRPRQGQGDWSGGLQLNRQVLQEGLHQMLAPLDRSSLFRLREPGYLEHLIEQWKQQYQLIVFDCSALHRNNAGNVPAQRVVEACDQALLCYLAGRTPGNQLQQAVTELSAHGAPLLGVVVNDQFNPSLRDELLRQSAKFQGILPMLHRLIRRIILQSELLALKV